MRLPRSGEIMAGFQMRESLVGSGIDGVTMLA
jgi:hypothetical protein